MDSSHQRHLRPHHSWRVSLQALIFLAACHPHLQWREAPKDGAVAALVANEIVRAKSDGKVLLVYVGAKWCEPCERFRQAAQSGALDKDFSQVRFFAFDFDRDEGRLALAGYTSPLIPLIVAPLADGQASAHKMFGSVKGERAVEEMTPRLSALLNN